MRLGVGGPWGSTETSSTALDFLTLSCMLTPPTPPPPTPAHCTVEGRSRGTQLLSSLIGVPGYLLLWKPIFLSTEESSGMAVCKMR